MATHTGLSLTLCTSRSEIEGMGAIQVAGDALEPESLARAFDSIEEVDAVISTVGGTSSNPQVDGEVTPLKAGRRWSARSLGLSVTLVVLFQRLFFWFSS